MLFNPRSLLFSVNALVAALAAVFVSLKIGLENPFWAMMTAYIVSNPFSGAFRSKAVFRLIGTCIGAAATVLLVPNLANAPVLLSLAMALWVGGCLFLALLDRRPRSYVAMLAGYTAAFIGFPVVYHPELMFQTAVLRAEEIGVGILCAGLMQLLVFPRDISAMFQARTAAILKDVQGWAAHALDGAPSLATDRQRRKLAADANELYMMATHLPFDTARQRPRGAVLSAMQDRILLLLPLVSGLEQRIAHLPSAGEGDAGEGDAREDEGALARVLADVRAWLSAPERPQLPKTAREIGPETSDAETGDSETGDASAEALRGRIAALEERMQAHDWRQLLTLNILDRLRELVTLVETLRELGAHVADPRLPYRPEAELLVSGRLARPMHVDIGFNLLAATSVVVAILACCAVWILSGWQQGYIAPMMAAVSASFFASLDDPVPAQREMLLWTTASVPIVALYQFAILPRVTDFATLALVLAPFLFISGLLVSNPRIAPRWMHAHMGVLAGLGITAYYRADFALFLDSVAAQLLGLFMVVLVNRVIRSLGSDTVARRVLKSGWSDLADVARTGGVPIVAWTSRMLDRVALLIPRLGSVDRTSDLSAADALRDLRVGINILHMHEALPEATQGTAARLDAVLDALGGYFTRLSTGRFVPPGADVLGAIDGALSTLVARPDSARRREMLIALTGLRSNLFPEAPGWAEERQAA